MNKDTNAITNRVTQRQKGIRNNSRKSGNKKSRKTLRELTLLDRFLFDIAMEDKSFSHTVLSIILDNDNLPAIRYGITEKNLEGYYDSRAVRLDLVAQPSGTGRRGI